MNELEVEINSILKSDITNLPKCVSLQNRYQSLLDDINREVSEAKYLREIIRLETEIKEHQSKAADLNKRITDYLYENRDLNAQFSEFHSKLELSCSTVFYLLIIENINLTFGKLSEFTRSGDDVNSIKQLENLNEIQLSLKTLSYDNLRSKLNHLINGELTKLKEKLTNLYTKVLDELKWPFLNTINSDINSQQIDRLQMLAKSLLKLELIENNNVEVTDPSISCLPVRLMVEPFRKRFAYHFHGKKLTNSIEKPEWYLTQTLNWIENHLKYFEDWIDSIVDDIDGAKAAWPAQVQFARDLVRFSVDKLNHDIFKVVDYDDDLIFNHYIDEALEFDKDLNEILQYPPNQINVYHVLTHGHILDKWISMEKKSSFDKMDAILSTDNYLDLLNLEDENKVTKCGDAFVTLLYLITTRYENISKPFFKLKFLDFQLELLDDFRIRLLQLSNIECNDLKYSKLPFILNTVDFLENILMEWGSNLHYLNLLHHKKQQNEMTSNESVFDNVLQLYKIMSDDILSKIIDKVIFEIKNMSSEYCNERWSSMKNVEPKTLTLTLSACDFFHILLTRLHLLKDKLTCELFELSWRMIAKELDSFLFYELILRNKFNMAGALRLKFDIFRNMFPIFYQYSKKSENYFPLLKESIILLNIEKDKAVQIWMKLDNSEMLRNHFCDPELKSLNVMKMNSNFIAEVLKSRTDVNLLAINDL